MPERIQRSRAKGWRMPENTIYVGRPGKFGNPFYQWMGQGDDEFGPEYEVRLFGGWLDGTLTADDLFRKLAGHKQPTLASHTVGKLMERRKAVLSGLPELRGKNLACWCRPGTTCHADVLLERANAPLSQNPS